MGLRLSLFMRLRHYPFLFKTVQKMFDHMPMVFSVTLHVLVAFLLTYDFYEATKSDVVSVPVFVVDLENIKIGERTNLPPKLIEEKKKPARKASGSVKTSAYSAAAGGRSASSGGNARGGKGAGTSAPSSSGAVLENELNKMLDAVTGTSSKPKKKAAASNSVKASGGGAAEGDPFKTLLASVDGIRGGMGHSTEMPDIDPSERATDGIEGGSGGSYTQELSVSEKDLLGLKLRQCWNLDPGVRGAQNMTIEIRAFLNRDGTVRDAKILDTGRYGRDPAFRSIAESARRAVYICDKKGEESPFRLFPKYYEQTYDSWKTLLLRFNPFDGGVS